MKDTGIVRNVDDLGRFVLPMELRKKLNINIIIIENWCINSS